MRERSFLWFWVIYLLLILIAGAWGSGVFGQDITGDGTAGDPYTLYNIEDVDSIRYMGDTTDKYFQLADEIDAVGFYWVPLPTFYGNFDGRMQRIKNLSITDTTGTVERPGLFSYVYSQATVKRIVFDNCSINLSSQEVTGAGILAPYGQTLSSGTVDSVWVINSSITLTDVTATSLRAGMLFGDANSSQITNCGVYNCEIYVRGSASSSAYMGGFVGASASAGVISKCFVSNVTVDVNRTNSYGYVGGFTGDNSADMDQCFSVVDIGDGSYAERTGAMAALSPGGVTEVYSANTLDIFYTNGFFYSTSIDATNSYFDTTKAGTSIARYSGSGTDPTGLSTADMKDTASYVGWDFTNDWTIDEAGVINDGYPYLRETPITPPDPLPGYTYLYLSIRDSAAAYTYPDTLTVTWETNATLLDLYIADSLMASGIDASLGRYDFLIKDIIDFCGIYPTIKGVVSTTVGVVDSVIARRSLSSLDLYDGSSADTAAVLSGDTVYVYNERGFLYYARDPNYYKFVLMNDLDFTPFGDIKDFEDGEWMPSSYSFRCRYLLSDGSGQKVIKGLEITYDDDKLETYSNKTPQIGFVSGAYVSIYPNTAIKDIIFYKCKLNIVADEYGLSSAGTIDYYNGSGIWGTYDSWFVGWYSEATNLLFKDCSFNVDVDQMNAYMKIGWFHYVDGSSTPTFFNACGLEADTVSVNIGKWMSGTHNPITSRSITDWSSDFQLFSGMSNTFGWWANDDCLLDVDLGDKGNLDSNQFRHQVNVFYSENVRDSYIGGKMNITADTTTGWQWWNNDSVNVAQQDVGISGDYKSDGTYDANFAVYNDHLAVYSSGGKNIINVKVNLNGIPSATYAPLYDVTEMSSVINPTENSGYYFYNTDSLDATNFIDTTKIGGIKTYSDLVKDTLGLTTELMETEDAYLYEAAHWQLSESSWNWSTGYYWRFDDSFHLPHNVGMFDGDESYTYTESIAAVDSLNIYVNTNYNPETGAAGVIIIDTTYYNSEPVKNKVFIEYRSKNVDSVNVYWANGVSDGDTVFNYIAYQTITRNTDGYEYDSTTFTWTLPYYYRTDSLNIFKIEEWISAADTSFEEQRLTGGDVRRENLNYIKGNITCSILNYGQVIPGLDIIGSYRIVDVTCGWVASNRTREYITQEWIFPYYSSELDTIQMEHNKSYVVRETSQSRCKPPDVAGYNLGWDDWWYDIGKPGECSYPELSVNTWTKNGIKYALIDSAQNDDGNKVILQGTEISTGKVANLLTIASYAGTNSGYTNVYYAEGFSFEPLTGDVGVVMANSQFTSSVITFFKAVDFNVYTPSYDIDSIGYTYVPLRPYFRGIYPNALLEVTPKK